MQLHVKFLLLADLVSHTREGKLNVMGEYNAAINPSLPVALPMAYVAARVVASVTAGLTHSSQLIVTDQDGNVLWRGPLLPFAFGKPPAGQDMRADLVYQIGGMVFPEYGPYSFTLWIDDVALETAVLHVQAPQPSSTAPDAASAE